MTQIKQAPAIGQELGAAVALLKYTDLPPAVVDTVKLFVLDTLGVIGGAARAPGMQAMLEAIGAWETEGKATLLLNGRRVSPVSAALANGAAAHSLDFDDQHDQARIHAFCVILPAVLAAVEAEGEVSGERLLTSVAVGVEVFCRLGLACYNSLGKGWHPTTALGTISAAAAVAKVFDLDAGQTLHAMALAFVQLSGTTQFIADGALAKRTGPGFAARSGVQAAQLARYGITGPHRYLDGKSGLFTLYERGEVKPELLTAGFGSRWHLLELSMKPYPCCRCTHTVIQLALDFRACGLKARDIESGVIELGQVNRQIVGSRFDRHHANPVVHAQFNAAYAFATALDDGFVDIASFTPERIRRDAVAWAACLTCTDGADIPPTAVPPARVTLTLKDGRSVTRERWKMKGAPDEPMTTEEVFAKFRSCLRWGFDTDDAALAALESNVMQLEHQQDAAGLIRSFIACQSKGEA
ncbi:MmgE/PrpD family protein [Halotalea alkalilenta]|uniref:MmgE/PrpD family protein n=1 Tax=Halotalea alkalilenta TaxID=376489 RepID=UPI000693A6FF|nr:MmgE/PrpD family protein [Halotalea alkalilenta]